MKIEKSRDLHFGNHGIRYCFGELFSLFPAEYVFTECLENGCKFPAECVTLGGDLAAGSNQKAHTGSQLTGSFHGQVHAIRIYVKAGCQSTRALKQLSAAIVY